MAPKHPSPPRLLLALTLLALLIAGWPTPPRRVNAAPNAAPAAPAAAADCDIWWTPYVLHDTFNSDYRSIVGPTTPNTTVKLRLRVAQSDITSARVRVWDDRTNTSTYYAMAWDGAYDTDPTTYDWWYVNIPVGTQPTILYYLFELNDAPGFCSADQDFYVDDDVKFYGGGYGSMNDTYDDTRSFQITVYDPAFTTPSWMARGIVYQIFPDRFRDGNSANNPSAGGFFYGANTTITRSNQINWNSTICDPRSVSAPICANKYSDNFYGGDLRGVIQKLDDGYFENLGVTVLYLNPIFRSPSNHKYDTADYMVIDPAFGTLADFQELATKAHARGIKLVLDGVFNHTASDSKYFDRYSRYDAAGNLTSPGGAGTDDQSGACESTTSAFRSWFYIPDIGMPGNTPADRCDNNDGDDPGGAWTMTYESWYGYGSLPKLQANTAAVRNLIWNNGLSSVGPYWTQQGGDGWRFDVGGDVDCGLVCDPTNTYWEGFRTAVRNGGVTGKTDTLTLGEEWGDASGWLLGNEWDSVMNYRFRSAAMSWLFTGCSGNGCSGGTTFSDNDSNAGSSSGPISALTPSQFNARLRSIQEDYPPQAFKTMMNLEGSHDTNRIRFLLKKSNNDNDATAVQRMKELWIFMFTYPGAPTLYYGDEIGLSHDGVWASGPWEDDPYNRTPYPWPDASGTAYSADTSLLGFARHMASVRLASRVLQDGDVQHGLIIDDANKLYGYARTNGTDTALIALNRDVATHNAVFTGLNAAPYNLPNGTVLVGVIGGADPFGTQYTVTGGQITVPVSQQWGVVLVKASARNTPQDVTGLTRAPGAGPNAGVTLTWNAVTLDTSSERDLASYYTLHRSTTPGFTPDGTNQIAVVYPPDFGATNNTVSYNDAAGTSSDYYRVCTYNSTGQRSVSCLGVTPTLIVVADAEITAPTHPAFAALAVLAVLAAVASTLALVWRKRHA